MWTGLISLKIESSGSLLRFVHRERIDERYWREEIIRPKEVAYCTFFVHFIELVGSLPCLHGIMTCLYPEPD